MVKNHTILGSLVLSHNQRVTDAQTDRQTDTPPHKIKAAF